MSELSVGLRLGTAPNGDESRTPASRTAGSFEPGNLEWERYREVTQRQNYFYEVGLRCASTRTGEHRSTSGPVLTWRERQQWLRATAKAICLRVSPGSSTLRPEPPQLLQ